MRAAIVILLLGCYRSDPPAQTPIGSTGSATVVAPVVAKPKRKGKCKLEATNNPTATSTTGVLWGGACDAKTGEPLVGATIVVTSPTLQGEQAVISDEHGLFWVRDLPPGDHYAVTFYYADLTGEEPAQVFAGRPTWVEHAFETSDPW